MANFELSSKKYKNGRRPFKATLYELQPPDSVVDGIGTKFNKNGITFLEEYAEKSLDSIKDMSVRVEFIDDERTMICAHGLSGYEEGLPLFSNATTVGHFTNGYISDIEVKGEIKRCVCGEGYLDEMCYYPFIQNLETQLQNGNSIDGSIEIYKTAENDAIVYLSGYLPEGRIPTEYIHSGWDMVINPADPSSTLVELNNTEKNKEELLEMDEEKLKELIQKTISETNSKNEELTTKITELNSQITEKDNTISELNATVDQVQKALDDLKKEQESYWDERAALEKELGELKAAQRLGELNSAIEKFSEEEIKFVESEINSFKEKPMEGNVDSIVEKIYASIGKASKENSVSEINSKENNTVEDIFSEINSNTPVSKEDDNIF